MKKILLVLVAVLAITACDEGDLLDISCDCEYVTYDNGRETYRSTWDASCNSEVLSRSTYTSYDGTVINSVTQIECK